MVKRYFFAHTANAVFNEPGGRIWIDSGGTPFAVERIDVSWSAKDAKDKSCCSCKDQSPFIADTFYLNWRHTDNFPDLSMDGELTVQPLQFLDPPDGPAFQTSYKTGNFGVSVPREGPFMWSPSLGESIHSFDLTPYGGIITDSAASDGEGVLEVSFTHEFSQPTSPYRISFLISQEGNSDSHG
jgi:hypothetical protein